ncbi:MAG: acyl-ACP--UDP-N-acetylglucosamine O-acyltransferase [Deltaproteobacteria bacterium]|jgi:UDP-N-acetylglucosamine acyltransferase|nr:acyl-ACP--UDP-N-acetylglucosamine O-acyltransferase [Deltaproteobacteria bacterium]
MGIHPTAIIDPSAELGEGVSVGPYSIIGPRVVVGKGTTIMSHVHVDKDTAIGEDCRLFPFSSVGADPQDMSYRGERTVLVVGNRVTIRESSSLHRGTSKGTGITTVGDDCLIMALVHVSHDCRLGEGSILASLSVLAGHVVTGPHAIIGGSAAVHQFVRVGTHSLVGGLSGIVKDVPPYMIAAGNRDGVAVVPNFVGLKRKAHTREELDVVTDAHRFLHNRKPLNGCLERLLAAHPDSPIAKNIAEFYRSSKRGVYR